MTSGHVVAKLPHPGGVARNAASAASLPGVADDVVAQKLTHWNGTSPASGKHAAARVHISSSGVAGRQPGNRRSGSCCGASSSSYVIVSRDALDGLAPGGAPERLARASFGFLLEREPRSSILRRFELLEIGRYFPEYPDEIQRRLA